MENKQKPSLILIKNHGTDGLLSSGVPFEKKMLKWPIMCEPTKKIDDPDGKRETIYKNVLEALSELKQFEIKVSFEVNQKDECLGIPKRMWGYIYLGSDRIVQFSHHSKRPNSPYLDFTDWAEIDTIDVYTSEEQLKSEYQRVLAVLSQWSVHKWVEFFKQKIRERSEHFKKKASDKRDDATDLDEFSKKILDAISLPAMPEISAK